MTFEIFTSPQPAICSHYSPQFQIIIVKYLLDPSNCQSFFTKTSFKSVLNIIAFNEMIALKNFTKMLLYYKFNLSNPLVYRMLPSGSTETLLCTAESGSIKLESLAL